MQDVDGCKHHLYAQNTDKQTLGLAVVCCVPHGVFFRVPSPASPQEIVRLDRFGLLE